MNQLPLLQLLADGSFRSGDELGGKLGVSRTAVWKAMKGIEGLGLEIHSVKGKGYRLMPPLELLDRDQIMRQLGRGNRRAIRELELLMTVDSTNSHAMRRIQVNNLELTSGDIYVCIAEQQTGGRGRRGRAWVSPFGTNMYLSVVREFSSGVVALEGLSLVVGLSLVQALKECGACGLSLKWPNDVLCEGRKLAGILLEMTGDVTGNCQVIIGIGLNINSASRYMAAVDQPWTDLYSLVPGQPGRNRIVGRVINHLMDAVTQFEREGFACFKGQWEALDAFRDAAVEIRGAGGSPEASGTTGIARGVNEQGALLLETDTGVRIFNGGEVSMRMKGSG